MFKAGKSKYLIGTKIRICNLKGEDRFLNGCTGKLTHPYGYYKANYVGVDLDQKGISVNDRCNLASEDEFELIKD